VLDALEDRDVGGGVAAVLCQLPLPCRQRSSGPATRYGPARRDSRSPR
jgi:hypothetical protein